MRVACRLAFGSGSQSCSQFISHSQQVAQPLPSIQVMVQESAWCQSCSSMPRPPIRCGDDQLPLTVMAIGKKTKYWLPLVGVFPFIDTCCIDVRSVFTRKWDEDCNGTGFDQHIRARIMSKKAWPLVWEISMCVLLALRLLIVV